MRIARSGNAILLVLAPCRDHNSLMGVATDEKGGSAVLIQMLQTEKLEEGGTDVKTAVKDSVP